ncbi:MAG: alpha-amylase family glycosyl hydrolase [Bryobacteraceae bacterium]
MSKSLILLTCLMTCMAASAQKGPDWVKDAVLYQIYPSSFQDSDGNGIGDLKGIQTRLDYVQSLGVNTIWLNPIFKSAFKDGGYDVIDFYQVDPRFGTNTDLVQLAGEVHRRGMHIVLDLVAGHSSNQSEWFKQSMQADTNLQYSDYYIWASNKPADMSQQDASRWVEANAPRAKYYIKNYYDVQPALNYGYAHPDPNHPWEQSVDAPGPRAVRRELQSIIAFWLNKGVDGFRVDLASSLVKNDPDKAATIALWKDLNGWFHHSFPQGVLVAEWFNPKQSLAAGFDIDFLRPGKLTSALERGKKTAGKVYFDKTGEGSIADWKSYVTEQYEAAANGGFTSLPTGSHDNPRIADADRNTPAELKVLLTFFLTQPGIPLIYYGDEIGIKYVPDSPDVEGSRARSGSRTPMQWNAGEDAGFSTAPKDKLYIPLDPDPNRPTVAKEDKDPASQLNYVRNLLKLRKASAALGNSGTLEFLSDVEHSYPMVYLRRSGKERYVIALNPSNRSVETAIASQGAEQPKYLFGTTESVSYKVGKTTDSLQMPPLSAAIFKVE